MSMKALYDAVPVWVQNAMLSAYGLHLKRLRYGPGGRRLLAELRTSQWATPDEWRARQDAEVARAVAAACRDVPFYRARGGPTRPVDSVARLAELPVVTKAELQAAGRDMVSRQWAGAPLQEIHTGGTTGRPLTVFCDRAVLQRNYAFFARFKEMAGVADGERVATFAGRTIVPAERRTPPFWRHNRASRTMLCSSYHIGPDTVEAYVEALERFGPALIDSYPSSIEPIARHVVARGGSAVRPRAVITSSETLFPEVRAVVEEAFGCPVFDHYGSAEMVALITQCAAGRYHVNPEFGVVELLCDGRPARPGEVGDIVATGFINPVMPLLRYVTGDRAVADDRPCTCGRSWPVVARIEGRVDDVIVTPEGRRVGRLDPIFKSVASLHETRIVQDAEDHVRVETVVAGELQAAEEAELLAQLRARLGPRMRIDIVRVQAIARTSGGKLRTVVNEVARQRPG